MEEIKATKEQIREETIAKLSAFSAAERRARLEKIERRLFEFANFLESRIVLLYVGGSNEVATDAILKRTQQYGKLLVLPAFETDRPRMQLMKVDDLRQDLVKGPRGVAEPNPKRCKRVPIDRVDIALIPGIAFDEKGGRVGTGRGYYDRLIPNLPITTRKVALAFEEQMVPQVPMEPHDKYVDIIITDQRIIYKI